MYTYLHPMHRTAAGLNPNRATTSSPTAVSPLSISAAFHFAVLWPLCIIYLDNFFDLVIIQMLTEIILPGFNK
jgi:hypothetical protein